MKKIVIIGAGPAGLMAATQLAELPVEITVVDQKQAPGRKFLVAGDGGFNLTHSEPLESFVLKYDKPLIRDWVRHYPPARFRDWLQEIGIETFVGSSGKVFPVPPTKPIQVLTAWLKQLKRPSVQWKLRSVLVDFTETQVTIRSGDKTEELAYDWLIIALGGASWKKTGSDGSWQELFRQKNIPLVPFRSSNSGLELVHTGFLTEAEGFVVKNVRLAAGETTAAGDMVLTRYGLEGKPVYAMNRSLRDNAFKGLTIDFKPQLTVEQIAGTLRSCKNTRQGFERLKIPAAVYSWFRETLSKEQFTDVEQLARQLKGFAPEIKGLRPLDEVISTVGGVAIEALEKDGSLKRFPNTYCAGEMIDWDAPTGGYLLQGCVSSGFVVGNSIAERCFSSPPLEGD
jgi:uncharacterized flavoprotein (TIGR03862 family)